MKTLLRLELSSLRSLASRLRVSGPVRRAWWRCAALALGLLWLPLSAQAHAWDAREVESDVAALHSESLRLVGFVQAAAGGAQQDAELRAELQSFAAELQALRLLLQGGATREETAPLFDALQRRHARLGAALAQGAIRAPGPILQRSQECWAAFVRHYRRE